jgi:hypothetical protein
MCQMSESMLLILTSPVPGKDSEFDEWYDTTHLPQVCATPGFTGASRWKKTTFMWPTERPVISQTRAALYTIDGSVEDAVDALMSRLADGSIEMTEFMDMDSICITPYEFISDHNA